MNCLLEKLQSTTILQKVKPKVKQWFMYTNTDLQRYMSCYTYMLHGKQNRNSIYILQIFDPPYDPSWGLVHESSQPSNYKHSFLQLFVEPPKKICRRYAVFENVNTVKEIVRGIVHCSTWKTFIPLVGKATLDLSSNGSRKQQTISIKGKYVNFDNFLSI